MRSLSLQICLLIYLAFPGIIYADNVIDLVKKNKGNSKFKDFDQYVVFDSTTVIVQESGLAYVTFHYLIAVNNKKGALNNNVIKLDYDPLSAYVEFKKVRIYKPDQKIIDINLSEVKDYPAPARMIYWGARQKMIEIGEIEPGSFIEIITFRKGFTYALLYDENEDSKYIPPMKGHFYDIVEFWSNKPYITKTYKVTLPATKNLQYKYFNGDFNIKKSVKNDSLIYCFDFQNFFPVKPEPQMVAMSDIAPKLLLSTSPDWYAKSTWFYQVNENYGSFSSTPEIDKKVKEILTNAKTEYDSIALLTHWVADELRYSGISMGTGEGYTLHKGEMNFTDRCGVCKDKAGMLVTMLRAAGFESYAAMTMAGSRIENIPADQFNHSVTVVKLKNGQYQILDPTWVPFVRELWSSREQQQNYLMGLPGGSDLMITPVSDPSLHFVKINIATHIDEHGDLKATFELNAEGQSDAAIRSIFTYAPKDQWKTNLEHQFLSIHPELIIDSLYFTDPYDYLKTPVKIKAVITIPHYAIKANNKLYFKPLVFKKWFQYAQPHLAFDTTLVNRKYPFADRCSRMVEISEKLTLPDSYLFQSVPACKEIMGNLCSYQFSFKTEKNMADFSQIIKLGKRVYEANEWPEFRDAIIQQLRAENIYLVVEKSDNK